MDPLSLLKQQKTAQAKQASPPVGQPKSADPADVSATLGRSRLRVSQEVDVALSRQLSGTAADAVGNVPAAASTAVPSLFGSPVPSLFGPPVPSLFGPPSPSSTATAVAPPAPAAPVAGASPQSGPPTFDDLLAGEKVMFIVKRCFLLVANPLCEVQGRLLVTNYRLKFQTPKGTLREELRWMQEAKYFDVPMGAIEDIKEEKSTTVTGAVEQKLKVHTKDFRVLIFLVGTPDPTEAAAESRKVLDAVVAFSTPGNVTLLFAFKHAEETWRAGTGSQDLDGWNLYDPLEDYARMGIDTEIIPNPSSPWQVSSINLQYELCATYPALLAVPRRMTEQDLRAVAAFRKRGRLPAMSWCGGPELSFASVWRCSQTTEGLMGQKSAEDQLMVQHIRHGLRQKVDRDLLVIDLRPWKSAWANKAGGGGFEGYSGCKLVFGGIDNIHAVRDGWQKMGAAVNAVVEGEVGSWLKDVANSGWYDYIGAIIHSAVRVVNEVLEKSNVMVHCSDGWDRTAQCTSLAMICLDAHYRTQAGFLKLIQKEFCSFGHRFRTRLALGETPTNEYSPVFIQWLDCVFQLSQQFPSAFEWSPTILLRLAHEALSNRFGTFLCDSEKERAQKVMPFAASLWSALLRPEEAATWRNPRYQPDRGRLTPSVSQANFVVWEAYWFRYHPRGQRLRAAAAAAWVEDAPQVAISSAPPLVPSASTTANGVSGVPAEVDGVVRSSSAVLTVGEELAETKRRPAPTQVFKDDDDEDIFAKPRRAQADDGLL